MGPSHPVDKVTLERELHELADRAELERIGMSSAASDRAHSIADTAAARRRDELCTFRRLRERVHLLALHCG